MAISKGGLYEMLTYLEIPKNLWEYKMLCQLIMFGEKKKKTMKKTFSLVDFSYNLNE